MRPPTHSGCRETSARRTMPVTAVGMRLRIRQRQPSRPRAADDHPACDAKFLADDLHVRDQMRQRIVFAAALWGGSGRRHADRTAPRGNARDRIAAGDRLAAAAGPAMQIHRGNAIGAANGFDVDLVAIAGPAAAARSAARTDRSGCRWLCPRRRQAASSPPVSSVPPAKLR